MVNGHLVIPVTGATNVQVRAYATHAAQQQGATLGTYLGVEDVPVEDTDDTITAHVFEIYPGE